MNGGRNYNGPKVGIAALEKLGYMLENPVHLTVLTARKSRSDKPISGDNQQETP